ncbi:hypothetical protein DPEC_G00041530 [Dallia pectoralis]|uniref:Uncharacterized protein n=1 Tax=Dallia pectoralis TaxID=75939 RepID=A0ACC2HFM3_DALPE|nr:hypothetical protein DPEC_G00041530 [Dallia pectoralis]
MNSVFVCVFLLKRVTSFIRALCVCVLHPCYLLHHTPDSLQSLSPVSCCCTRPHKRANAKYSSASSHSTAEFSASTGQNSLQAQTLQDEMTRSFPGFFSKRKGKKRFSPLQTTPGKPKVCNVKPFSLYVYLVNKGCTSIPSAGVELELSQAGLGKRSLTLTDEISHAAVV